MEKCGKFGKNSFFSGQIWPDWGNTVWADMAGLGSIGLRELCIKSAQHPQPQLSILKPIFYQACFSYVGADNAIYFALGTFQIFFTPKNIEFLKGVDIVMNKDPKFKDSFW